MFQQTIRAHILTIFLLLLGLLSFSILASQYYFSYQLAEESTQKTFKLIAKNITTHIENSNQKILTILNSNIDNSNLNKQITFDAHHPAFSYFTQIIESNRGIYSIYITQENGSFYEILNMNESPTLYSIFNAPKETRWTNIISIKNKTKYSFFNKDKKFISSYFITKNFNPKEQSWYKMALNSQKAIMTPAYKFTYSNRPGITYATQLKKSNTILAIDYTLQKLHTYLELQKFEKDSEIFLFDATNHIVVSSKERLNDTEKLEFQTIDKALKVAVLTQKNQIVKYKLDNNDYFSLYSKITNYSLFLGIKVDAKYLLAPYIKSLKYSFILSILLLLFALPIIFLAVSHIVKPIKALITQNQKIKNRQFNQVTNIQTNIIEFIELSDSFVVMSQSIQEYQKSQAELLDAIVKLIAEAVDAKSAYTGGHCERVPKIAQMLIAEATKSDEEVFKEFSLRSEDELREFEIGAWLHDCGKVTTPEYVVDKATKLETINNRIHEIRTRFEVLWRDAQILYLESKLKGSDEKRALELLNTTQEQLLEDFKFIADANIGGEFMNQEKQERIKQIAEKEWQRNFDDSFGLGEVEILRYNKENTPTLPATEKLLSDKKQHIIERENFDYDSYEAYGFKEDVPKHLYNYGEIYNLSIAKGTLSAEERYKINEHVILTIKMLEKIPFPAQMEKIPEYAGTHHETLIGTGYPRKLKKEQLSIAARIMALSDVFEALTASDRPYKKAKTLSESIKILSFMVKDEHLDANIFKLFLKSDLHNLYAKKYLKAEQIDKVDIEQYL